MDKYILEGHKPIKEPDLLKWAEWFEKVNRIVKKTKDSSHPNVEVSTVFLGADHGFNSPAPILFETMIFGCNDEEYQTRCSTWEEAEAQHLVACKLAFGRDYELP